MQTSTVIQESCEPQTAAPMSPAARCAFTIDVEDWYQSSVDFDAPITDRVVRNVERVRELLHAAGIKGTFFVQGMVAEAFPQMLQQLLAEGHEIQSHGYSHRPLFAMSRPALRKELEYARKSVEDACGEQVTAFRAPDFSIMQENLWALDALAEAGFTLDSSIFPIRMKRYGIAGWPLQPTRVELSQGRFIWEAPVAIWHRGLIKLPVAGGGYFRLLPLPLLQRALAGILAQQRPAIIYCHPYEFSQGELEAYRGKVSSRFLFLQGLGRGRFVERMRQLLQSLPFSRLDEVMKGGAQ